MDTLVRYYDSHKYSKDVIFDELSSAVESLEPFRTSEIVFNAGIK